MTARVTREEGSPRPASPRGRRGRLAVALVLGSAALAACGEVRRAGTPPENLVLVTVDTLRADRMSAWGAPRATTDLAGFAGAQASLPPGRASLDRLAAEGVVFANAFSPRGQTFPATATLFTGRPPLEHGCFDNEQVLCAELDTLAEVLRDAGFETAAFTTNALLVPGSGIEQGFETFFTDRSPERDVLAIGAATDWLLSQDLEDGPPFFLWLHLMGPHMPYAPTPLEGVDYAALFTDPAYARAGGGVDGSREVLDEAYRTGRRLSPEDVQHVRDLYDGEIARIDHVVSLLVEVLSGTHPDQPVDVLSRSIFAFAADHGEELEQRHGYWAHSKSVYDSVLHVPLFLRHPATLTGRRVFAELVELQDVLPTVLHWLDVPSPPGVAGRSLLPLVDGGPFESRAAHGTWSDRVFTVRTDDWRLVHNPDGVEPDDPPPGPYPVPETALFDVRGDPLERHDVSAAHPDVVRELRARIETWRAGLRRACEGGGPISPERLQALRELGYAGEEGSR